MTTFPRSPRVLKGGIVVLDPDSGAVERVIALQYNPDNLSRTLQVKGVDGEGGDRSEALRLTGPPVETISLEAEIDVADHLEFPDEHPTATEVGIHPQLAVLESLISPTSDQLESTNSLATSGALEIVPVQAPLAVFVWSVSRVVPVRLTEFSVTEEAFDIALNPMRATVKLGMRVLSIDDVGFDHKGGRLFMSYLKNKESLAARDPSDAIGSLGLSNL